MMWSMRSLSDWPPCSTTTLVVRGFLVGGASLSPLEEEEEEEEEQTRSERERS